MATPSSILPGESHRPRSLAGSSPGGRKKSQTQLSTLRVSPPPPSPVCFPEPARQLWSGSGFENQRSAEELPLQASQGRR